MRDALLARAGSLFYRRRPFRSLMRRFRPRACILCYHRVARTSFDPFAQAVSPETFERQLAFLRRNFAIVPLDSLVSALAAGRYCDHTVAITFDDGYADTLATAYPIAARLGIPITVFVTVQPVLEQGLFWWDRLALAAASAPQAVWDLMQQEAGMHDHAPEPSDWRAVCQALHARLKYMPAGRRQHVLDQIGSAVPAPAAGLDPGRPLSVPELQTLSGRHGVQIGAHTMTHPALAALPAADQRYELSQSRRFLSELAGYPVTLVAYPFGKPGDVSAATYRLALESGYRAGCTTQARTITPMHTLAGLPRMIVHDWPDTMFESRMQALFGEQAADEH